MSVNHQYIQLADKVVKKYARTTNKAITGYRLDPNRLENRIDWLLASKDDSFEVVWNDGEEAKVVRTKFDYEDEVIELYSETEVKAFERFNRGLLERGILTEYTGDMPEVDTTNILTDVQIVELAATKNLLAFKKRLQDITSKEVIDRIGIAVEKLDRPMSIAKAVQDRKREL